MLITPAASSLFGVTVKDKQLEFVDPQEVAIAKLSMLVADIAETRKSVSELYTKQQRVDYAQELVKRPIPTTDQPIRGSGVTVPRQKGPKISGQKINPKRKPLIPSYFRISIPQARLNNMYHELQKLNADEYPNSAAALLRIFVELSADWYADKHKVVLTETAPPPICPNCAHVGQPRIRDLNQGRKLLAVADHMENNSIASKAELAGVRKFASSPQFQHSIVSLNAYVHNKDLNPRADELRTTWDDLQIFIARLWNS